MQGLTGQSFKKTKEDDSIKCKSYIHYRETHMPVFSWAKYVHDSMDWDGQELNFIICIKVFTVFS